MNAIGTQVAVARRHLTDGVAVALLIGFFASAVIANPPAAAPPQTAAPTPGTSPAPAQAPTTTPAGSAEVQAITLISATAIKSAEESTDQVKWVFSIASLVITAILAILTFLGVQNVRNIAKSVREEARRRIDEELVEAKRIMSYATQIAVRTQAALRQVMLAEKWAETDGNRQALLRKAIVAVSDVRAAAESLQDTATRAWTHTFEAYCLRGLHLYNEAIAAQLISMQLSEVDDPLDRYNAACFYALVNNSTAAALHLRVAIENGGERFKSYARNDVDFSQVRNTPKIIEAIGPPEPIDPMQVPDKSPPSLVATKTVTGG